MNTAIIGSILLSGFGFGLLIAAPVGPMSILCMNRTLDQGFRPGFTTGLGIALADAVYALVTVSGFKLVGDFTASHTLPLRLLGSLFLGYLGVKALLSGLSGDVKNGLDNKHTGITFSFVSAFLLTLANPATILTFMALAASLGKNAGGSLLLPAGILLGSSCWWLLLSATLCWISHKLPLSFIRSINSISSVILILFSLYGIWFALLWDRG